MGHSTSIVSALCVPWAIAAGALHFGLLPPALRAEGERQNVTIRLRPTVGRQPFSCTARYTGLGTPGGRAVAVSDFRLYLSQIALADDAGREVPLELEQDGRWQHRGVALIDFEDKTGSCTNGTAQTRDVVVGTVPKGNYRGLRFTLGIPFEINHEDASLAPSPLNLTALWWNWQSGYKFLRIDVIEAQRGGTGRGEAMRTKQAMADMGAGHGGGDVGFPIHLGSTGCRVAAGSQKPSECAYPNTVRIALDGFDPSRHTIVADLAALVAGTDLARNRPKTAPGCMSEPDDLDCAQIVEHLGLGFGGKPSAGQTFFRVE